jgi:DNA-binding NarL/FixJ family response regulator
MEESDYEKDRLFNHYWTVSFCSGRMRQVCARICRGDDQPDDDSLADLTERELDVLQLVARGKSNRVIAESLVIAEGTVKSHVSSILSKLHLAHRTQAALYALKRKLVPIDDLQLTED